MLSNPVNLNIFLFLVSFVGVWFGSGLIISEVSKLSRSLKLSSFTLSFFLLGMLTSLPEITIGITAIVQGDPQIFVGNLIGGVLVIFLVIIPLLALAGGGVSFPGKFDKKQLLFALFVCLAPSILASDQAVTAWEGVLLIGLYIVLFLMLSKNENWLEKFSQSTKQKKGRKLMIFIKMVVGVLLLVAASNQIVDSTEYFAELFSWSPFLVSLILVSVGTNIPELSLVFRSIFDKKKGVALADYVGSASANTVLFGVFSVIYGTTIAVPNHFFQRLIFIAAGLVIFYVFSRSKNRLSRFEGFILIGLYVIFVFAEIMIADRQF